MFRKSKLLSRRRSALNCSVQLDWPLRFTGLLVRAHVLEPLAYDPPGESVSDVGALNCGLSAVVVPHWTPDWPASSTVQRPAMGVSRSSLSSVRVGTELRMLTPGAARSTCVAPKLENEASWSR